MKIYTDPLSVNCRKVISGLKLMGVEFQLENVDYFRGEHKNLEYLEINPNGSFPSMVDDDLTPWESNAILQYAADKESKNEFYPTNLKIRADINRWLLWELSSWFPSCYVYLVKNMVKPILGAENDAAILAQQDPTFNLLAGILDKRLGAGHGVVPQEGTPDNVVSELENFLEVDRAGATLSFIKLTDDFPFFRDEVLPELKKKVCVKSAHQPGFDFQF